MNPQWSREPKWWHSRLRSLRQNSTKNTKIKKKNMLNNKFRRDATPSKKNARDKKNTPFDCEAMGVAATTQSPLTTSECRTPIARCGAEPACTEPPTDRERTRPLAFSDVTPR